jgi:alanine-synthesizing transaminase
MSCVPPRGAFYAFPRIDVPEADDVFVKELLLEKHILVVHGSGFGQKPGTKHVRIVFLPQEEVLKKAYSEIRDFVEMRYGH